MAEIQSIILYFTLFVSLFFEIFLLITYFEVRDEMKFEEEHIGKNVAHFPSVSIIVPCYNEEKTVMATVQSILNIDYPKDRLSVILVNDGSTDNTLSVIKELENHPQVRIYSKENGGKHTALNFALEKIDTELVGCLDADSFVSPDALRKIVPYFDDASIMAVTPSIKVHEPKSILQQVQKVEYSWGIFLRRMLSSIGALYVTPGPFSIFRTTVFRELGGYRKAHHTEDLELALRMQKNRYKIVNSHGAHVYTVTPEKLGALYKQRVRWTYGFLNNAIDYKELFFNRQYGHIGIFVMPIATVSIFTTLFAAGNMMVRSIQKVYDFFFKYQSVGFEWKWPTFNFDWFFLNTGVVSVITTTVVVLTLVTLFIALKVANGRFKIGKDVFYYLTLYIFIVPLWLAKAVFNTVFKKNITWR
jgi:cellulose synthase/poly-beta-1,6-N-acetylglucosamine synthase-like glycosyltransferase